MKKNKIKNQKKPAMGGLGFFLGGGRVFEGKWNARLLKKIATPKWLHLRNEQDCVVEVSVQSLSVLPITHALKIIYINVMCKYILHPC